jgi:hypothetical protein
MSLLFQLLATVKSPLNNLGLVWIWETEPIT